MASYDNEPVGDYASSVGQAFESRQIYSLQHPEYINFSNDVTEELTRIAARVAAQRSTARPLVVTTYLDPEEAEALQASYPEFAITAVVMNRSVHSYWLANRVAANEWCAVTAERYSTGCIHYGGFLLQTILRKARGVHLEMSPADEVLAHQYHADAVDVHRMFSDYATVQSAYGVVVPRVEYDEYLKNTRYGSCREPSVCTRKYDAMCVDLSVSAMSLSQVALGMVQHGAELCQGFFIYHPIMLTQQSGELPGTGVSFRKTDKTIDFLYPEGRAGVRSYNKLSYAGWLSSHSFSVGQAGSRQWFQLELLKNRGVFMFFRLVRIDAPVGPSDYRHALDLPCDDDYSLVKSWRLKRSFRSNVNDATQWEPHVFLVRTRVLKRVTQFAMQLQPAGFTRFAIKKQIRVVNNRWVINGSTVTVSAPLSPQEVEDTATAVYARTFVDRYESSQLSAAMMAELKKITAFHSASMLERLAAVASVVCSSVLAATVGKADQWIRGVLDGLFSYFSKRKGLGQVEMLPGPTYITMRSAVLGWKGAFTAGGERLYKSETYGFVCPVVEDSTGGSLAALLAAYGVQPGRKRLSRQQQANQEEAELASVVRVVTDFEDTRVAGDATFGRFVDGVAALNEMDSAQERRYVIETERAIREAGETVQVFKTADDPDPVFSLNSLYLEAFPAVANQSLEFDTFSLSLDPQDRTIEAPMLRMPTYFGLPPAPRGYYRSKLVALNVPKRQNTAQELLTAISARNLSAPVVAVAQDEEEMVRQVWENFLKECCVPEARTKLKEYQDDPVALAADSLTDWASKAKPGAVDFIVQDLEKTSRSLGDMEVGDYLAMLKADVKPTLSTKPVGEITAPQVIVYHEKPLSALYSSIFRVLVRRFLSILKSNYHLNLLKDSKDVGEFITANHPFGQEGLRFLENDFSKYDKSQSRFVFLLEEFVFKELGMNQDFLAKWAGGHVECSIRSLAVGLSLHVMYQRKSGDGTTAFGNGILNLLSVSYAYRGTRVVWAVLMGDDSLVCADGVVADADAVRILAEVFNLTGKFFITDAPYFASNFVLIDNKKLKAVMCPDPVKRVERLSMHVSADDPQWNERHTSFKDAMGVFVDESVVQQLAAAVPVRYEVSEGYVRGAAKALGTLATDKRAFRALWEESPSLIQA